MAMKTNRIGLEVMPYRGGKTTLCAGCGHNAISERIIDAFFEMGVEPSQVIKLSGIGCSSKSPAYFLGGSHGFNTVHGRMPSIGTGAMLANKKLIAIGISGDGDTGAIGIGQFVHLMRRNLPIIYIIEDNGCYGLTKGQFSPTSPLGLEAGSTPYGSAEEPLNPLALTIAYGATFVARGYSGKPKELTDLIVRGIQHKGFAFIDVISPCITYYNTYKTIPQQIAPVPATHDVSNPVEAFKLAHDTSRMYLGLFYQTTKPTYEERLLANVAKAEAAGIPRLDEIMAEFV